MSGSYEHRLCIKVNLNINLPFLDIKGLKDSQQVEKLQDDTQVKFSEYVRAKRGDNPARFGRLLLTLLTFERVTQEVIEKLFFRTQSENVSVEYILHDMFKSN